MKNVILKAIINTIKNPPTQKCSKLNYQGKQVGIHQFLYIKSENDEPSHPLIIIEGINQNKMLTNIICYNLKRNHDIYVIQNRASNQKDEFNLHQLNDCSGLCLLIKQLGPCYLYVIGSGFIKLQNIFDQPEAEMIQFVMLQNPTTIKKNFKNFNMGKIFTLYTGLSSKILDSSRIRLIFVSGISQLPGIIAAHIIK